MGAQFKKPWIRGSLLGIGLAAIGLAACNTASFTYGDDAAVSTGNDANVGATALQEVCGNLIDDNNNERVDEFCPCNRDVEPERDCYSGPVGTLGKGVCKQGSMQCVSDDDGEGAVWSGRCRDDIVPARETGDLCHDGLDNDCDGRADNGPDCGEVQGTCDATTCPGGCCLDNICYAPFYQRNDRCGLDGDTCSSCGQQKFCRNGRCRDRPGACGEDDGDNCIPKCIPGFCGLNLPNPNDNGGGGSDAGASGSGDGGGDDCTPACTGDRVCVDGDCQDPTVDPDAVIYEVWAISALLDMGSFDCDLFSRCDPFIRARVAGIEGRCSRAEDDHSPEWNERVLTATREQLLAESMWVKVYDDDHNLTGGDDSIDICYLQITEAILEEGRIVSDCGSDTKQLTLEFRRQ